MNNKTHIPSILLVDDQCEHLKNLESALKEVLTSKKVDIRSWQPSEKHTNLHAEFEKLVDEDTVLVATDYDLTKSGMRGLFGDTVVRWCKQRFLPVGDFSRANATALTKRPELFELRIPANDVDGAPFIANVFLGFLEIRDILSRDESTYTSLPSLSVVLAKLLERQHLNSHFSLYMSQIVMNNSAIVQHVSSSSANSSNCKPDLVQIISYLLGHLLVNAIMKFPGPILSERALSAYLATTNSEIEIINELFEDALYKGPFSEMGNYFWLDEVNVILEKLNEKNEFIIFDHEGLYTTGEVNRKIIETEINRVLQDHDCKHCGGKRGGFYCPFTHRTVCTRDNCSVSTSSWIPRGADVCRIEREIFDEWSPILGL